VLIIAEKARHVKQYGVNNSETEKGGEFLLAAFFCFSPRAGICFAVRRTPCSRTPNFFFHAPFSS
jgi:hypothetical protein